MDIDYTGIILVVLFNHSDEDFIVNPGDKIAQIICEKIIYPQIQEISELPTTIRGEQGFGSTGV